MKLQGVTFAKLAELLPVKQQALSTAFQRNSVQPEYLEIIERELGMDSVNEPSAEYKTTNTPAIINYKGKGVPYYDVDFLGGFDDLGNDQTIRPSYYIDHPAYNDADYWVNVTGKSMSPFISHGDMIAVRTEHNWKDFLLGGEIYAIVTDTFRTVKKVRVDDGKDYFTLIPQNQSPEFTEQKIPKKLIRSVFRVMGCEKRFV
ncbi:hypothetical protein AAU57_12125 [Nonlabens sp. YIK11]|nr:hypothetical protein AAU57_12125 [Nonlabens sp. YIK11]